MTNHDHDMRKLMCKCFTAIIIVCMALVAAILLLPRCACADEVVTFVHHNGLVTELYNVETYTKDFVLYTKPRFVSFTGTRLVYDTSTNSLIRTTAWRREGDAILIFDAFDEPDFTAPVFVVPVDKIEYQFYNKDYVPKSFDGERLG